MGGRSLIIWRKESNCRGGVDFYKKSKRGGGFQKGGGCRFSKKSAKKLDKITIKCIFRHFFRIFARN